MVRTLLLWFLIAHLPGGLRAETILTLDGTKVEGTVVEYTSTHVVVQRDGARITLPKAQIERIEVNAHRPDARLGTPEGTLNLWIDAARKLDSEGMLRCYVSDAQAQKRKEFQKFKTEELRRMQADAIKTRFHVAEPLIIGNRATVKVDREFGKASETEIFELVLERG